MCMPYLHKIFGGANRHHRRNSIGNHGSPTPLNSLANVQQMSLETTSSMDTITMSTNSSKSIVPSTVRPFLPERPAEAGNGTIISDALHPSGIISMPCSKTQSSASATGSKNPVRPHSWWTYFGMNKNKKTSIESL